MLAAHEHNEEAAAQIVARLREGESVALVLDAGTPGISDPGARIVARVRAGGFRAIPCPGAVRSGYGAVGGGASEPHFLFYGFLLAKARQREEALREGRTAVRPGVLRSPAPHSGDGRRAGERSG